MGGVSGKFVSRSFPAPSYLTYSADLPLHPDHILAAKKWLLRHFVVKIELENKKVYLFINYDFFSGLSVAACSAAPDHDAGCGSNEADLSPPHHLPKMETEAPR